MSAPIPYSWNGTALVPLQRFAVQCARDFLVNGIYRMRRDEEASDESRGHYFACIRAAFDNLPEVMAERFASPEHLRKWCLIRGGYRNEHTIVAGSADKAEEIATLAGVLDDFAVVMIDDNDDRIVRIMVAKTQKRKRLDGDGMDKTEFEASKEAVLRECSRLVGTDVVSLLSHDAPPVRERAA